MFKPIRTIAIVCLLMSAAFVGLVIMNKETTVSGITLYVGGTGGGNFTAIQDAINASFDGDTVFVYNKTYYENIIVNRSINLIGMDMSNTTIDGSGLGDVVNVTSSGVNITGFTITSCGTNSGDSAVELYMVTNCDISYTNLSSINGSGVFLDNSDQNGIFYNIIWNNVNGIHLISGTNNNIGGNKITGNLNGVYIENSTGNSIFHNNFIGNSVHAFDDGTNLWNLLPPTGGNFWDNWTFPDADCDGFVDDPFVIAGGSNRDYLPFTEESAWMFGWFNKSAFANYAPSGMPDFDQREKSQRTLQNYWMTINAGANGFLDSAPMGDDVIVDPAPGANNISIAPGLNHLLDSLPMGDDTAEFSYCGPTAAANALWWLDSRYADPAGVPGDGFDIYSLITDILFLGDDHLPENVPIVIEDLATRFNTINMGDTNATAMVNGLQQLISLAGLSSNLSVSYESFPDFPMVANEFEKCNAVILFLGFYDDEGKRILGHIVTMSGVDQGGFKIAISDPIKNIENPLPIYSSYNDTINVSHDTYDVMMGPPHPSLPPQTWWLSPYTSGYSFPMPPFNWAVVEDVVYIKPQGAFSVPTEPLGLSESSGNSYVNITWSPPADDGGSAIVGYNVYRDGGFLAFVTGLWYNDTTVTNGVTYLYNVSAVNGVGEGPWSTGVWATPLAVPSVPQNLQANSGNGYVNLTWLAPADDGGSPILFYNIYRNGTVGVYDTVPASQLWYNDANVTNGLTYTYNISAVNALGEGPQTADVIGTPTSSVTAPSEPLNLQANSGNSYVNLTWIAPASDGGSAVLFYNIYRNGTMGVYDIVSASQLWYNDTSVTNGLTYTYNVSAVNAIGEGPNSTGVSATPMTVPTAPQAPATTSGNGFVEINWTAPVDDGGFPVLWYNIYRSGNAGVYKTVPAGQLWYNDTNVTNGVTYTYNISAVNSVGEGPRTGNVSGTPMTLPSAPQNLQANSGNGFVNLTWTAPVDDGGSAILFYNIYRNGTAGVYDTVPASQLWYNDSSVINGLTYTYNISAVNSVGEGLQTSDVIGTPTSSPTIPSAPQNLGASSGNGYVNLTWTAPASDGGSAILFYNIYRNGTVGVYDTVPASQLWYNDTSVTNGLTYTYNVSAVNAIGEGLNSTGVSATPMTVPSVPQNLQENSGNSYVNLTWTVPASSGGSAIVGYNIYRNGTFLAFVSGQLWYNDTTVTNGVTYTYNVTAVNGVGEGPNSTGVSATPMTVPSDPQNLLANSGNSYVNLTWTVPASSGGSAIVGFNIYRNGTFLTFVSGQFWYNDSSVTNGVNYTYNVTAVNGVGEGPNSTGVSATPMTVPSVVENLGEDSGSGYVNLTWDVPLDDGGSPITNYYVYKNGTVGPIDTLSAGQRWYNDSAVFDGITYTYNISAVNLVGEGPNSTISATPNVTTLPSEPQNLQAASGDSYVNLSWAAPSSDGGSAIIEYYVYRNDTAGPIAIIPAGQLWFNDSSVTNGEFYSYNVSAVNVIGEGPNATGVSANPLGVPSAPQNPQVVASLDLINITWEAPSLDGGTPITGYNLYRNGTPGVYAIIPPGQLWYNDTNVTNNTMYTYNITAENTQGEGPSALVLGTPLTTPTEPLNLQASAGSEYVLLTWNVPLNNGSSDITAYYIYRNDSSGIYATVFGDEFEYNDTLAKNGVNYTYHVAAVNAQGLSPNSTNASARPEGVPLVPTAFSADPGNGFVNLTWEEPFDSGQPITEYFLYRNGTVGPYATLLPDQLWFNDTVVTNGVIYTYTISANNSLGEGEISEEIVVMAGSVPSLPWGLTITSGDSTITITWKVPKTDGGMPITNYKVYQGTSSGSWTVWEPFTTDLSYTDTTVANGLTYYYVVTAVNFVGESAFSEEVFAVPVGVPDAPQVFSATAHDSYVILTWSEPFSDGGSPITGYKLYRGTTSNESNMTLLTSDLDANDFSYNDSQVTNGITYFYWISAESSEGEGPKTTSINATPESPVVTVNEIPTCEISAPVDDVRWYGTATISGTASDSDGEVEKVEIRFDDGNWIEVNGTTDWSHEVDTKELPNGEMVIYARSFDGENYSKEVNVTVNVDNPTSVKEKGLLEEPGFWVGLIILVLILLLLFFMLLKKRKPKEEYDEEEEEEDEDEDEEEEEEDEEEEDEDELEEEDELK